MKNNRIKRIKYNGKRLNSACEWYKTKNPLKVIFYSFLMTVMKFLPPCSFKNNVFRRMGVKIGRDVVISPGVLIDPFFPELITIGDGSIIGWDSKLITHEYLIDEILIGEIKIGKKALIGNSSIVRPGTVIGDESIIGYSSLVNRDVPPKTLVGGLLIRIIRKLK
jgi:acetyltransferase-like isoleucine patch superfamily enzyme